MLIIPAIHISGGLCLYTANGEAGTEGKYPCDPAALAKLWRVENAKSLHVVDLDSIREGRQIRRPLVRAVVEAVDIPVQLAAGFRTLEEVHRVFRDCGIYRAVIGSEMAGDSGFIASLIGIYGPRRIVVALDAEGERLVLRGRQRETWPPLEDVAGRLREAGVQRIVLGDASASPHASAPPLDLLRRLADNSGLSITVRGFVRAYPDLKNLQDLRPRKIDSIILDEALYSNAFPCQKIWRLAEKALIERHRLY